MIRCNSCGGLYEPIQDGMRYFHACPSKITNSKGDLIDTPNPRNENITFTKDVKGDIIPSSIRPKLLGSGAVDVNTNQPYDVTGPVVQDIN